MVGQVGGKVGNAGNADRAWRLREPETATFENRVTGFHPPRRIYIEAEVTQTVAADTHEIDSFNTSGFATILFALHGR